MIDTTTSEGFLAARLKLGLSDNAMSNVLGIDRRKLRRWENDEEPHPTAAAMVKGLLGGFRPLGYPRTMTGQELWEYLEKLGITELDAAIICDVPDDTMKKWLSDDRGPTPIAIKALEWFEYGWRNDE